MSLIISPRTVKWPFFVGDALLLGLAGFFYSQGTVPMTGPTLGACVVCVMAGAVLGVTPFILDYRAAVRLAESNGLAETVTQIQGLESIATAIAQATGQWQGVNQHANETVTAARSVSEQMTSEMKSFVEFFEKANDSERQHLRLEVDKLKRGESEWLGVLVRIMDHVFALHSAASRSADPKVVEQMSRFQLACRDAARRVGLVPFEVEAGSAFDSEKHQLPDNQQPTPDAQITTTLATGFNFRGQMVRPALVQLSGSNEGASNAERNPLQHDPARESGTSSEQELAL